VYSNEFKQSIYTDYCFCRIDRRNGAVRLYIADAIRDTCAHSDADACPDGHARAGRDSFVNNR